MRLPLQPGRVILAIGDAIVYAWAAHATSIAGIAATVVIERADLFDLAAGDPAAIVTGDRFAGAPAEHALAALRTAGCDAPAIVLAPWRRPALVARMRALAPIELLVDPFDGAALCAALRRVAPAPTLLRTAC